MNLLRKLRIVVAFLVLTFAAMLFLDFTGTIHHCLGWVARIQLVPALLALNVCVIIALVLLTALFGRLYCSVICPLGIFQDVVSRFASMSNKKRKFTYTKARTIARYVILALFIVAFLAGLSSFVAILDPYSTFGLIVSDIFAPIYKLANNGLALIAEHYDSYAFYSTEILIPSIAAFVLSIILFFVICRLAWKNGRTYCNVVCPVGTVLGFLSKFSLFKIYIDKDKCNGCRKCVRTCKSACITPETRDIDYSRCVVCFDCIDNCKQGAVSYKLRAKKSVVKTPVKPTEDTVDVSKQKMLTVAAAALASSALKAQEKFVDGGLSVIIDKKKPKRENYIVPAGAMSIRNFSKKCIGCQLCVSVCPNHVLRPATRLTDFLQPEMSYEIDYCRPECTKCSEVCPTGAIEKIDAADKSSIQIGHAVLIEKNCVVLTDGVDCGNCAVHCPVDAIIMIEADDKEKYGSRKIPYVNTERCIGCGACENLCPARPYSAIYVEGKRMHKTI